VTTASAGRDADAPPVGVPSGRRGDPLAVSGSVRHRRVTEATTPPWRAGPRCATWARCSAPTRLRCACHGRTRHRWWASGPRVPTEATAPRARRGDRAAPRAAATHDAV